MNFFISLNIMMYQQSLKKNLYKEKTKKKEIDAVTGKRTA